MQRAPSVSPILEVLHNVSKFGLWRHDNSTDEEIQNYTFVSSERP